MSRTHTVYIGASTLQRVKAALFDRDFKSRFHANVQRHLDLAGKDLARYLAIKSVRIHYKHRFMLGWRYTVRPMELAVFNAEPHAIFVEKGRKPNSRPPPAAAIAQWVKDKLGPSVSPYIVAQSIGRKGIAPRPVMLASDTQAKMLVKLENHLYDALQETLRK